MDETINGVTRFKATCLKDGRFTDSVYDHFHAYKNITVSRRTLEREICRTIEEMMYNGGTLRELSLRCMTALDADALAEQREAASKANFYFDTDIVREKWQRDS
jgi:hypothetical protein